jgi:hypothetical protein
MVKVPILNCGRSAIKCQLYDAGRSRVEAKASSAVDIQSGGRKRGRHTGAPSRSRVLWLMIESLPDPQKPS